MTVTTIPTPLTLGGAPTGEQMRTWQQLATWLRVEASDAIDDEKVAVVARTVAVKLSVAAGHPISASVVFPLWDAYCTALKDELDADDSPSGFAELHGLSVDCVRDETRDATMIAGANLLALVSAR